MCFKVILLWQAFRVSCGLVQNLLFAWVPLEECAKCLIVALKGQLPLI